MSMVDIRANLKKKYDIINNHEPVRWDRKYVKKEANAYMLFSVNKQTFWWKCQPGNWWGM